MSILSGEGLHKLLDGGRLKIDSTDSNFPFSKERQVTNDGIDLRLGFYGYTLDARLAILDTLEDVKGEDRFCRVDIPTEGLVLQPRTFLLSATLERVMLEAKGYLGRITGRSLYARMGLSVNLTQQKWSGLNNSIVPLQLVNHAPVPLVVYPRQMIVCLQLEVLQGTAMAYKGLFANEHVLKLPVAPDSERSEYSDLEKRRMFQHTRKPS